MHTLYIVTYGNDDGDSRTLYMGTNLGTATIKSDAVTLTPYQWLDITKYTLRNDEYVDPTNVLHRDTFPASTARRACV